MIRSYLNDAKCSDEKWNRIFSHKMADDQLLIKMLAVKKESNTRQKEEAYLESDSEEKCDQNKE